MNRHLSSRIFSAIFTKKRILVAAAFGLCSSQVFSAVVNFGQPAAPIDCSSLPPPNPNKGFFENFNNACYISRMSSGSRSASDSDLYSTYQMMYYKVVPGYELIVASEFPNARFNSFTVYDSHAAQTSHMIDADILPLTSSMVNPFRPGVQWIPNQQYAVTVGFGDPEPQNVSPGCSTALTTADQNFLDASQIHSGLTWTGYPDLPQGFPAHQTGASVAGYVMIRNYVDDSSTTIQSPGVIVRNTTTGCAVPAAQVASMGILSPDPSVGGLWLNNEMVQAHSQFADDIQVNECYSPDPLNQGIWTRGADYVPGDNNDASYMAVTFDSSTIQSVVQNKEFIRLRFKSPTVPNTPCVTGSCALTGSEQLRYYSISFMGGGTLATVKDTDLVVSPEGYVDLIVGMGQRQPDFVNPTNYYSWFDLSKIPQYGRLSSITIRNILPNSTFHCSGFNVPYKTMEYNPVGGFMGEYVATLDYPKATDLSTVASPVSRPDSCDTVPPAPVACGPNVPQ